MSGYVAIMATAGSAAEAQKIATALVEGGKAACVQMIPATSCYMWKGALHTGPEVLLIIKTRDSLYADVEALILSLHSDETPEIVCLPVTKGASAYLDWIASVTG